MEAGELVTFDGCVSVYVFIVNLSRSVNAIFIEICIFSPSLSNQSNSNHSQEGGEGSSVYDVRTKECVCHCMFNYRNRLKGVP